MTLLARLAAAVWLALSAGAVSAQDAARPVEVAVRPIETFAVGSGESRFGALEFVGGLEMSGSSWDFGGLSAFRFLRPGGDFMGVTDTGLWFFGSIVRDAAMRPVGIRDFSFEPMVDGSGKVASEKWDADAEGLAVRDGVATVGFERRHRIARFRIERGAMKAAFEEVPFLVPLKELRRNRGFETVIHSDPKGPHGGSLIIVSEKSLNRDRNIFAAVLEGPRKGIFAVQRKGEFDITDGAELPDGDLLLLERSFSMAAGVKMRLRRIPAEAVRAGSLADGPILMQADMGNQIDNMEALDVWRREDGALMLSLLSDDNFSILQRNLYLEFVLHED